MDILIKGMEMPKSCLSCPMKEHCPLFNALHFNERLKMLDENRRVDDCPLVELPPHGRLGDLDRLAEEFDGHGVFMEEEVKKIIDFFPAIVEATE